VLVGNPERNTSPGRPWRRWEDINNIKIDLKNTKDVSTWTGFEQLSIY
jgi:hypothetical protein